MKIEDYNWDDLYKKTEGFIKENHLMDCCVHTNEKTIFGNDAIVKISFPKRINAAGLIALGSPQNNGKCVRFKGVRSSGVLLCVYGVYASRLS